MKDGINVVYRPARLRHILALAIMLPACILALSLGTANLSACVALQPCDPRRLLACIAGVVILLALPFVLYGIVNGLPRITLSDDGMVLQTIFTTRRIHWVSLGAFQPVTTAVYRGRRITRLVAPVTGRSADAQSLAAGKITLMPGNFAGTADLGEDLNAWRRQALANLGITVPAPARPQRQDAPAPAAPHTLRRAAGIFLWLWLALLAGVLLPVGIDLASRHLRGTQLPAGALGGLMVLSLAIASLAAGTRIAAKSHPTAAATTTGTLLYLLSTEAVLATPHLTNNAKIGLAIIATMVPLCTLSCLYTTTRGRAGV